MKTDNTTTIKELKDLVAQFTNDRHWKRHHKPKNLAMSIAIEAAELMEHFVWERDGEPDKDEVAAELADVIFNCLNFALASEIDISQAFMTKYQKLQKKYPVSLFNKDNDSQEDYQRIKKRYRRGKK